MSVRVEHGDSRDVLPTLAADSIHAVVCDPPYAINFMGRYWDTGETAFDPAFWKQVLRVLKPGGHLLAFGGTRSYHRLACAVEDAGFEIRDQIGWLYGSGFPKSHDVSKGIDKAAGAEREVVGVSGRHSSRPGARNFAHGDSGFKSTEEGGNLLTAPATEAARQWQGWGTALKPAWESIVLARKPLSEGTVAANVLEHGTGAINVDGCRVCWASEADKETGRPGSLPKAHHGFEGKAFANTDRSHRDPVAQQATLGRWPANILHDGSDEVLEAFARFGESGSKSVKTGAQRKPREGRAQYGRLEQNHVGIGSFGDTGTAARFFYTAKADKGDRLGSKHPTVKPVDLMAYLCRLVTPPGGTILDPFAGSGTTGMACLREGFDCILIEREAEYVADIRRRLAHVEGADAPLFAYDPAKNSRDSYELACEVAGQLLDRERKSAQGA